MSAAASIERSEPNAVDDQPYGHPEEADSIEDPALLSEIAALRGFAGCDWIASNRLDRERDGPA
jgi:hypothetical protein